MSKNNYEWWAEKGLELFDSFFSRYSSGEDEHTIYTDVVLPLEERYIASGGDVAQYQYRSLAQPYESADEIVGDIETFEDYAVLKARIVAMDITYLEVNCVYGSESASKIYTIINQSYNDIYQIANMIIEELFNNQIDIFKEDSFDSGYTEYALSSGEEYLNFGVIQISYALINNDGTYVIEQGVLKVANGFQPTEIQLIFLQVNIKFEAPRSLSISLLCTMREEISMRDFTRITPILTVCFLKEQIITAPIPVLICLSVIMAECL